MSDPNCPYSDYDFIRFMKCRVHVYRAANDYVGDEPTALEISEMSPEAQSYYYNDMILKDCR